MKEIIKYNLPEWAFLDAHSHLGDALGNRTVILHVRSASVIEIIDRDNDGFNLNPDVLFYNFKNTNRLGVAESLMAVLHYCATLNQILDRQMIVDEILIPCAKWYCSYCDWKNGQILDDLINE